jgi:signal transduction histidine kinase
MRERVYLAGGTLQVDSDAHGTLLRASLPRHARSGAAKRSDSKQAAP